MGDKDKFVLLDEVIENANRYVGLAQKIAIAKIYAKSCIKKMDELDLVTIVESNLDKELVATSMLLTNYLKLINQDGQDINPKLNLTVEEYNYYMDSNLIEDLPLDIYDDWMHFVGLLEDEIQNEINYNNKIIDISIQKANFETLADNLTEKVSEIFESFISVEAIENVSKEITDKLDEIAKYTPKLNLSEAEFAKHVESIKSE